MYKITLSDGTVLDGLDKNGNNYVSKDVVSETTFDGKLTRVTVSDGEDETTIRNAVLTSLQDIGGKTYFILGEKTEDEKRDDEITSLQMALADIYEKILGGE